MQTSTLLSLETSLVALEQQQYSKAIGLLEAFCHDCVVEAQIDRDYFRAQMHLIAVYEQQDQLDRAIALCQKLLDCPNAQVQIWARQKLVTLDHPGAGLDADELDLTDLAADSPFSWLKQRFQAAS